MSELGRAESQIYWHWKIEISIIVITGHNDHYNGLKLVISGYKTLQFQKLVCFNCYNSYNIILFSNLQNIMQYLQDKNYSCSLQCLDSEFKYNIMHWWCCKTPNNDILLLFIIVYYIQYATISSYLPIICLSSLWVGILQQVTS